MLNRPTCVDLFCGGGGLSFGLTQAGFELRSACDIDPLSIDTYRLNQGGHGQLADVREWTAADVFDAAGISSGDDLHLLAGGPPCQGFSKQKRGAHLGDPRNALVLEFLRLVEEVKPRAFLLENVAQIAQARGKHLIAQLESLADYTTVGGFYVAADYGLAQLRQRYVMVGTRHDLGVFTPPGPTVDRWISIGEALGDLPEPPADFTVHPDYPNHQAARVTAKNIERFSYVPQGGGWQDIPWDLRLKCHQTADVSRGGWPDVYGRLEWDGQCPTITGGFDSFTRGRYGHPLKDRPLTPREAARLQGFPDDYVFVGTRHDIRHQIGNAVPVPLARAVGESLLATFDAADRPAQSRAKPLSAT